MASLARDVVLALSALAFGWMWGRASGHDEATAVRAACVYTLDQANEALSGAMEAVKGCVEATGIAAPRADDSTIRLRWRQQ